MLVRTQVSLDPETHRRAKRRAHELGISLAALTRRALRRELEGEQEGGGGELEAIFGLGASGGSDVARHKESYLAEASRRDLMRKRGADPGR